MRRAVIIALIIISPLLRSTGTSAAASSFGLNVTTKVLPVVKYEIMHQEKSVLITEENMMRGYIDVYGAVIFSVMTNSENGYVMTFFIGEGLFKEAEVFYDSVSSEISGSNNEIYMPSEGMKYTVKKLSFRFYLSDIMIPGVYDWPVVFTITAV